MSAHRPGRRSARSSGQALNQVVVGRPYRPGRRRGRSSLLRAVGVAAEVEADAVVHQASLP
eukprot:9292383-Heterocapsa_arctica.AAC.1